jgi:hypothetical protein
MSTPGASRVVGLDISTSVTGITVLDPPAPGSDRPTLVLMTHVELGRLDGFWPKVDELRRAIQGISSTLSTASHVFVEESLQAFRPGLSSASTLMTLAKFNGVACMIVRDVLGITPTPLSATSARKSCGVRVQRGTPAKLQTFKHMTRETGPLAGHSFPMKRQTARAIAAGKRPEPVSWAYDEVDSYVIAWAGLRCHSHI